MIHWLVALKGTTGVAPHTGGTGPSGVAIATLVIAGVALVAPLLAAIGAFVQASKPSAATGAGRAIPTP
jgi:hypothetical protein